MSFKVINKDDARERECDSKAEAQEVKADMEALGLDVEIVPTAETDGGAVADPNAHTEIVETDELKPADEKPPTPDTDLDAIDQLGESLGTDPLSILPSHMVDTIQGQPAVNKRGYAMIAERYEIGVSAEIKQFPWDNAEGRCVARASARTMDGREYTGWATACADDGDMADQVIELAETRALKRAVSWASGVGIVSYVEMTDQLGGGK